MLERTPYKGLSHAKWRKAMAQAAGERLVGTNPAEFTGHLESSKLLRDALKLSRNGTPTTPHWTSLPLLP